MLLMAEEAELEPPMSRVFRTVSISSMKMTVGAIFLLNEKTASTTLSDSPSHLLSRELVLRFRKAAPDSEGDHQTHSGKGQVEKTAMRPATISTILFPTFGDSFGEQRLACSRFAIFQGIQ